MSNTFKVFKEWKEYKFFVEKDLLEEGRIDDAKAKFPKVAKFLDSLISSDTTGLSKKYPLWIAKQLDTQLSLSIGGVASYDVSEESTARVKYVLERFLEILKDFNSYLPWIANKDVSSYKAFSDLSAAIYDAKQRSSSKEKFENYVQEAKKAKATGNAEIILIDPQNMIVVTRANNFETSCKLGYKAWCVSYTQNYWERYQKEGYAIYFIHFFDKSKNVSSKFEKTAIQLQQDWDVSDATAWDERDNSNGMSELQDWVNESGYQPDVYDGILNAINKSHQSFEPHIGGMSREEIEEFLYEGLSHATPGYSQGDKKIDFEVREYSSEFECEFIIRFGPFSTNLERRIKHGMKDVEVRQYINGVNKKFDDYLDETDNELDISGRFSFNSWDKRLWFDSYNTITLSKENDQEYMEDEMTLFIEKEVVPMVKQYENIEKVLEQFLGVESTRDSNPKQRELSFFNQEREVDDTLGRLLGLDESKKRKIKLKIGCGCPYKNSK